MKLADLKPDSRNPRKRGQRAEAMLVASLQEVGLARSIVIDEAGNILAGNGTVQAAAECGMERVQVVDADGETIVAVRRTGLTPEQKRRLSILDNRTGELAEWDAQVLAELAATGTELDDLFAPDELNALLGDLAQPVAGAGGDEFDATPDDGPTRVQPGEVWRIGPHRIVCGDCTDAATVARVMDGATPDLVFADPPYGINIVAVNGFVVGGEADKIPFGGKKAGCVGGAKPFGSKGQRGSDGAAHVLPVGKYAPVAGDESTDAAIAAYNLMAELFGGATHVWWGGNYYADHLPASSCWLVWDKQNTGNFADAELAWTNRPTAVRVFRHMWNGMLRESERGVKRVHPTQKPVALAEWVIDLCECKGHILDPFAGSGMSLIAAHRKDCTAHLIELSPDYCDVILRRAEAEGIGPIERIDG